jgi:DNA-binding Lrp family transcriptional regulator
MFGSIESTSHIDSVGAFESQNTKIAGIVNELSTIFNGSGLNPSTQITGSSESGFSIQGGTFVADPKVHAGLANKLDEIYKSPCGSSEISGGKKMSREVMVLKKIKNSVTKTKAEYNNLSTMVQTKVQNLDSLKDMLEKTFNRLYELAKEDPKNHIHANHILSVQTKVMLEFDRQLGILQNILKVNIKPTHQNLVELLKKNEDFTTLAETLGVAYGDETASDRLALVFTNVTDTSIMAQKVKEALKELEMSFSEYKNIKNSKELSDALYSVFKKFNKKKLDTTQDLTNILEAMNILKTSQGEHDEIIKALQKSGRKEKSTSDSDSSSSSSDSENEHKSKGKDEIDGGAYDKEIGRQVKTRLKSSLSKRVQVYEKTMKELYKTFMNQINNKFKSLVSIIDLLTTKVGSEISYDDDLKDFIKMFLGFNENISNEKIFYSLINLDNSVAGKEIRTRFVDTLGKIINSSTKLHNFNIFKDITSELKGLHDVIDTMSDTVLNLKKAEEQKSGSGDFMWTDKLVEQSFSMNNIKLMKESIKRLAFYSKVATIKENLHRMNKEQKFYQEDYDQLLGKSIGLKLTELQKEYVENVDRLNDKTRGRGRLLEEWNSSEGKDAKKFLPRGLVETIYKLQYEAKDGLYRSLEAIDLYLMHFTEQLSAHPEAVMDLNKMLEQTDIIAKWFTKKSVGNMIDLLDNHIDKKVNDDDKFSSIPYTFTLPPLLQNSPVVQEQIKVAFERTKKCIDSIAVLKNIISMFIHLGEKYGNVNLTEKLHISPNMIYKHLVKYIWVSAFTMGYETGGGNRGDANKDTVNKGSYEPENGDFESFFNVLFTTLVMPLDTYKEVESRVLPVLKAESAKTDSKDAALIALMKRLRKDVFIIDDRYFILGLKAMIGKIFTVVDTHTLLKTPDTLAHIMRNPVRMIIGAGNVDVIPDAIELYIRLPLLVEFYKSIFEDGNLEYKNNANKDSEVEVIAYIPEIGTVWSGLIQCIFDESKYIKDGIYSITNMKDIVNEVNKIYNSYKSTPKDKLVRTVVLDLVSEINRRYGILKQKDIAEFYQIKKKYVKNVVDAQFEDNVNFDILDENNEYERTGPSSKYVESSFNKYTNDALVFTDIKLVRDFRNNIYNQLFGNEKLIGDLSTKSFNEKIKHFKQQIIASDSSDNKFELIAQAIDQSSNINAYNVDVYLLYNELVQAPLTLLKNVALITKRKMSNFYTFTTSNTISKLQLISNLYQNFNDGSLFKVKQIANNRFIVDFSNAQTQIELYIENIKYMISKFRNLICTELINDDEKELYRVENSFLNITIKNDSSAENYNEILTLDYFNNLNNLFLQSPLPVGGDELYAHIMFGPGDATANAIQTINNQSHQLLQDIDKSYDASTRSWSAKGSKFSNYIFDHKKSVDVYNNFENKSILQKFNMLVFSYLEQFYNTSTKKIYTKLIDEFANKAMSAAIFEQGGIPDIFGPTTTVTGVNTNAGVPETPSVLSMTTVMTLRTLLTRTLNIQLPVKYHLIDTIAEVSTIQVEKYKAYLPSFITYFERLIEECIIYKKLLDNPSFKFLDLPGVVNPTDLSDNTIYKLTDDFNAEILFTTKFVANQGKYTVAKNKYDEVLNNIINGSRALINDATNVLNELNEIPQFGNIRDNFIKNFYNNNRQLPYLPLSLLAPITDQTSEQKLNLLPVHTINSNSNKYIYGTNVVLNYNNKEDINNYLWLKEQLKIYNNGVLSTNNIETKKVNQCIDITKDLTKAQYYNNHVNYNVYWRGKGVKFGNLKDILVALSEDKKDKSPEELSKITETLTILEEYEKAKAESDLLVKSDAESAESKLSKLKKIITSKSALATGVAAATGYLAYAASVAPVVAEEITKTALPFALYLPSFIAAANEVTGGVNSFISYYDLEKIINFVENQLNENKKHTIVTEILGKTCTKDPSLREYNLDRSKARILNIIDLNINPINVHALMREVPLVNIYNYAFTFDNVIKSFVYNVDPDNLTPVPSDESASLFKLSCLLQDPYFIDTGANPRAVLKDALDMSYKATKPSASYDPNSSLYLAKPKYTHNIFEELNTRYATTTNNETGTLYHNNKFLRNILFLVNAQRVIRLKIKKAVYRINTNVVSDSNILNMRITDYPEASDMQPKDDEFEITDLF